jgi:hypothetical protein
MSARPQKITFAEMRSSGVRGLLIYCSDYKRSHHVAISGDQWPDVFRLSDLEPRFICSACGKRGADVRPDFHWDKPGGADEGLLIAAPDDSPASALEDAVRLARPNVSDGAREVGICSTARAKCDRVGVVGRAGIQFGLFHCKCSPRHTTFNFDSGLAFRFSHKIARIRDARASGCHAIDL